MKNYKCAACGVGTVAPVARPGRVWRYKQIDVAVPADLVVRTCDNCGEEYIHASEAKAFDEAMEPIYRETVREKLMAALVALEPVAPMTRIERILPVSEGYLSKLKLGRAEASPQIVSALCMLATSPQSLETLEALWAIRPGAKFTVKAKGRTRGPEIKLGARAPVKGKPTAVSAKARREKRVGV